MSFLSISLIAFTMMLSACGETKYADVSTQPGYRELVGATYAIVGPVNAYGIRKHSNAAIEYVTVIPPPGIEGSEQSLGDLLNHLVGPGLGLELVSNVNGIPKGSRLAVSTNLLASLIAVCMRATGQAAALEGPLSEPERRLLRRLPVFAGGWTLAAAEAVCADRTGEAAPIKAALPAGAVLDALSHLAAKSLVVSEPTQGVEARFQMLETIREYA